MAERSSGGVQGFFHVGVAVTDMDRSLEFYRDGLGLEVVKDVVREADFLRAILQLHMSSIRVVFLAVPCGGVIELLEHRGIERFPAGSRPCDPGSGHMCLFVENADELAARLIDLGFKSRSSAPVLVTEGPFAGAKAIYFADPDGFLVELFQRPPATRATG